MIASCTVVWDIGSVHDAKAAWGEVVRVANILIARHIFFCGHASILKLASNFRRALEIRLATFSRQCLQLKNGEQMGIR